LRSLWILGGSFAANPEIRDDGEIADGLSDTVTLPCHCEQQAEIMIRVASEFGFTPASRSRISAPPPDQLPLLDLTMADYEQESAADAQY
jgi:hypothetical protein